MHKIPMSVFVKSTWAGVLFTFLLGSLWHFLYSWSMQNPLVGLIAPVNESPWEHTKLLVFPMLIYLALLTIYLSRSHTSQHLFSTIFTAGIFSLFPGIFLIPALFYLYTAFTKQDYLLADILIFIISICVSFLLWFTLISTCSFSKKEVCLSRTLLFLLLFFYLIFTVIPPDIPPFTLW